MIIGLSGKKQSGKDLTGKIFQALTDKPTSFDGMSIITEKDIDYKVWDVPRYKTKKFADKLKDITCLLTGLTREQLESEEYKNLPLGPKWNRTVWNIVTKEEAVLESYYSEEEAKEGMSHWEEYYTPTTRIVEELIVMTPRKMLQLLGTECGRQIIHPDIWVNSLFADCLPTKSDHAPGGFEYPNWIITDVRFPNEAEAIKERHGLLVRLESNRCNNNDFHPSETALDNYGGKGNEVLTNRWDKVIYNNGTILDLVNQVKRLITVKNIK